jgi:hypothetical protein
LNPRLLRCERNFSTPPDRQVSATVQVSESHCPHTTALDTTPPSTYCHGLVTPRVALDEFYVQIWCLRLQGGTTCQLAICRLPSLCHQLPDRLH